jgi:predicted alpha-1,2-mannosidase
VPRWGALVVAVLLAAGVLAPAHASTAFDPAALVDPFVGTGVSVVPGGNPGAIDDYPAATTPFGMVQWGPDTSPDRADGGGYSYEDSQISGFSLTHLSGPGCAIYGDIPILPAVLAVSGQSRSSELDGMAEAFSHANESASPGEYAVSVGDPAVRVELTATTRTGLGSFTFPATTAATFLIKGDGSANGIDANDVDVAGPDEVTGSVTSGQFCQTVGSYRLYFALQFDRPFASSGTWSSSSVTPGGTTCSAVSASGAEVAVLGSPISGDAGGCGAWVTFDTTKDPVVEARVGVSYTGVAGAEANLRAEQPGWSVAATAAGATAAWNRQLGRIQVNGGAPTDERTFYTALYHSLLDPNVFDDADGDYIGFDGKIHRAAGYTQYANFSEWDIYRSEIPLLAMIDPQQTSDMMQSLVEDAEQGGRLPKWELANFDSADMNGDSADPILAAAWAGGARSFDASAALSYMVLGATVPGGRLYPERQNLVEYLLRGWVHADAEDLTSFGYTVGGSETLEYAIDDFSISRLAVALGDSSVAAQFEPRGANWQHLFNPATGYLSARNALGQFPSGPAFQPSSTPGVGQDGWEEGNSIQYTWSVPQDLAGLFELMGGEGAVVAKLDRFFGQLNAGRYEPYDWAGNEPSLGIPWEYDYAGAPWRTQDVVRQIASGLYADTPGGEPGNDDLGAMSSWLVWADLGLYPETPGTGDLVLGSPLFASTVITRPGRGLLVIDAPFASAVDRYVAGASVDGAPWSEPWLPASVLGGAVTLQLSVQSTPDQRWGAGAPPPSFGP